MRGLDPRIHALSYRPVKDVDGRDEHGHDQLPFPPERNLL